MEHKDRRISIGKKMYIFVILTVLFAVAGIWIISYKVTMNQIDRYYKRLTISSARNYASLVDVDALRALRSAAESEEFQAIRDQAEELDDESLIENYLREHGLWDMYVEQREHMRLYQSNMDDIKYLYIVAWAPMPAEDGEYYDMYILDSDDVPLYETGYYEQREPEFDGQDPMHESEPVISNGDWGWLCSGYAPVYDADGHLICTVGCDVGMEAVMADRRANMISLLISAAIFTLIVSVCSFFLATKFVVQPLNELTSEMKKFSPKKNRNYKESGVIDLKERRNKDEIDDIYNEIRSMQIRIIDYIDDITAIKREKEKAEIEIDQISHAAMKDDLTGIGNKKAYDKKTDSIRKLMRDPAVKFAIIMMDINGLKTINDTHGHNAGDIYIKGCCHIMCDILKRSPVYRIGGDEFVAILTGDDFDLRDERVKELRDTFEKTFNNTHVEPWERYSASIGIGVRTPSDDSYDAVFKRADSSMYEEKNAFKKDHRDDR